MPHPANILVVEDETRIAELIREALTEFGYTIDVAHDGVEGLDKFQVNKYDMVITDYMVPRMDGMALCQEIRRREAGQSIPLILMSAVLKDISVQSNFHALNVKLISKPFNIFDFQKLIEDLLDKSAALPQATVNKSLPSESSPDPSQFFQEMILQESPLTPEPMAASLHSELPDSPFSGKLSVFSVPTLLLSLHTSQKSGCLHLKSGTKERKIYFFKGIPVFAELGSIEEQLSNLLVLDGKVTNQQVNLCMQYVKQFNCKLGEALVMLGFLTNQELEKYLRKQIHHKIRSCFKWENGTYEYTPDEAIGGRYFGFTVDLLPILFEGAKRYYNVELLQSKIDLTKDMTVVKTANYAKSEKKLNLDDTDQKLSDLINNRRSISQISELSGISQTHVLQFLWALKTLDMIIFV